MRTAAALLLPNALSTSLTLPLEILHAANQLAGISKPGRSTVKTLVAADNRRLKTMASGLRVQPDTRYDALPAQLDLIILPAIWRNPLPVLAQSQALLPLLRTYAEQGARICAVGTSSYLLAEAGLLDGRPATTHWHYLKRFQQRYPAVACKSRHLITQSDNLYCAGSVNSIADLMVHIVEDWFGGRIARAIENQFSPEIRQPFGDAAWQDQPLTSHHDETVLEVQHQLQDQLANTLSMPEVAQEHGLSTRTLNRRFKAATGMTPLAYLSKQRVAAAKELLRQSNLAIGEIGWRVGMGDGGQFARVFKQHSGVTPQAYRRAVRGKLFAPEHN